MQNARLDEAQTGIKTARKNIRSLRHTNDITFIAEREEESERGERKSWLKTEYSEK